MVFGNFHTSTQSLKKYLRTLIPLSAIQLAVAIGPFAAMIMIAQTGGPKSIGIMGLCNAFIFTVFMPITLTIIDVGGVYFSTNFGAKKYDDMIDYAYKTLLALFIVHIFWAILFYFSGPILVFIQVDPVIALPTGRLIWQSMFYLPFTNMNNFMMTYLSSQNVHKYFNRISLLSSFLTVSLCYYFIIKCDMVEMGFIPAKVIQESVISLVYLILVVFEAKKECIGWFNIKTLFIGFGKFAKRVTISVISVMGEYISFEVNTYLAALLHNINDFAIWGAWSNAQIIPFLLSFAISNTFRTNIGQLIGAQEMIKARNESIAYCLYTFVFAGIISVTYWIFLDDVAAMFFTDPILAARLTYYMKVYLLFLFWNTMFYPSFTLFRLLKLDHYFVIVIAGIFPVIVIVVNTLLCFYFKFYLSGLIFGHVLVSSFMCAFCLYKIFFLHDWESEMSTNPDMIESEVVLLI